MKFTQNGALELSRYGIRMNAIAPGYTDVGKYLDNPEYTEKIKKIKSKIPIGRFATPEEIAHAAVFLASDMSGYMTGACMNIDGGILLPVMAEYGN